MFRFLQIYKSVLHGVALIPLAITIVLTLLALFLTLSPAVQSFNSFVYAGGYFEVRTSETARAVLTSIFAGIISLTVFGFSMMIVVVNQAASIYSPKVVETLSSERSNQYILGVNLGTIIFALIVMMHIDNKEAHGGIPELAIFVNVILAVYCLLLFVRFINNISNSVRINNIIEIIYRKTKHRINESLKKGAHQNVNIKRDGWKICRAKHGGYFRLIRIGPLLEILMKHDAIIKVLPLPGTYYLQHEPLFAINKDLDEDTENKIRAEFVTYHGEVVSENAVYGFRQLREIAVKALSPGINDPGVAILCIEHLSDLLSLQTGKRDEYCIADGDMNPRILTSDFDFKALLELSLVPVKTYGKRDYIVLGMLLHAAYQLSLADISSKIKAALEEFALSVLLEADENIQSTLEREVVNDRVLELNSTGCFSLALLKAGRPAQP